MVVFVYWRLVLPVYSQISRRSAPYSLVDRLPEEKIGRVAFVEKQLRAAARMFQFGGLPDESEMAIVEC